MFTTRRTSYKKQICYSKTTFTPMMQLTNKRHNEKCIESVHMIEKQDMLREE
jgi:hypothetical protein